MTTRMAEAALLVGNLVPDCVQHGYVTELSHEEWLRLSTGERAAYEIAQDLWSGAGGLARFIAFADQKFAGVLMGALTVAMGGRLVPVDEGVTPLDEPPQWRQ
jgi:hypothetical protein